MLTIGTFSGLCHVTRKTLRHYDEIGLLRPERDAVNGYRYYTLAQLHTMRLINRLKGYGFSLPEISLVLAKQDSAFLAERLMERRKALRTQMDETERLLEQISADADNARKGVDILTQKIEIQTKDFPPVRLYSIRKTMATTDFDEGFAQVFREAAQKGLQFAGPPVTIYHDEDFNPDHSDMELGVVVQGDRHIGRELAPGFCAYLRYQGPYDGQFTESYSVLAEWAAQNGYEMSGAPFDVYIKGSNDASLAPSEYVTEVYFPVRKK